MTGDILERIKAWVYTPSLYQVQLDAAEEIEKLRGEVTRLKMLLRYEKARIDLIEADYSEKLARAFPSSSECPESSCQKYLGSSGRCPRSPSLPCRQEATPDSVL